MTALERCVGDAPRFLGQYWANAPLHRRAVGPGAFADLLSLADVDHIVASTSPRRPSFRLVKDGKPLDPARYTRTTRTGGETVTGVADPERVFEEFRGGATIVLQGLQRTWPPLGRFCRELESELTHPVQANAYITPPHAQGLAVHYDTHDVFVLQIAGAKEWSVYEPVLDDPLPSQPWVAGSATPGDPCLEVDLADGDVLYVPRGFLHSARSRTTVSAHLTIGILAQTWYDVVRDALAGLAQEPEFRRALRPGFAHDPAALTEELSRRLVTAAVWLEKSDAGTVAEEAVRRFWTSRPAHLGGHLQSLLSLDLLDDGSQVRRRPGSICVLLLDGDRLVALLGDRELRMPAALEPPVRRLAAESSDLRVGDLADHLDAPSRLVLVRRLVREGLLEVVEGG